MSTTEPPRERADREERLGELPPSAKLVYKVLEYDGTLTQGELAKETLLPARTVRYALNRLEEADLVASRFSFTDARKRIYSLGTPTPDGSEATSGPLPESL
jgi:DNA-binding MarR family transcriptional regulator